MKWTRSTKVEHRDFGGGFYPHRSRVTGYHSHL